MNEQQVQKLIAQALETFKRENTSFRAWQRVDAVTDQFSPMTGASQKIGFFGTTKVSKQTITGSRGANAALASLLTGLSNLGLIVDSSS